MSVSFVKVRNTHEKLQEHLSQWQAGGAWEASDVELLREAIRWLCERIDKLEKR